jgi:hypothetical protein
MTNGSSDTELLGRSAFLKLEHGFAIRDRLRDVLAHEQAIERENNRRDSDEYTSRTAWAEWVLESDLDYTEVAFPLRSTEKSYNAWAKSRREWSGPTVFEVLKSSQPFNAVGTGYKRDSDCCGAHSPIRC